MVQSALFILSAFCASFFALYLVSRITPPRTSNQNTDLFGDALVFLVRNETLIDANVPGRLFLDLGADNSTDISALKQKLSVYFDDVDKLLCPGTTGDICNKYSRDRSVQAVCEATGDTQRITVQSLQTNVPMIGDIHRQAALDSELETLRKATESAPYLVWRENADGTPIWVNAAYHSAVQRVLGPDAAASWPLPRIFTALERKSHCRVSLKQHDSDDIDWFECHQVPLGDSTLFTAFDANSAVRAEVQLKDFMQTLTKTFAQLTTGLAIFDRSRNIALFNPALTELTKLPVEFLASRPSLVEFLDKLRENRMMPEPKDYQAWRKSLAALEAAAVDGSYSENWSLPGNLTYRVTGRPHPDGAIAFLFEDISAEISLTRHFRRELETSQSMLDNLEDATVLFSANGQLFQTNRAYRSLWGVDPDAVLAEIDVVDASRTWLEKTLPTPVWGDFRQYAQDQNDRLEWSASASLRDGRQMECKFIPMAGGGTQVVFRLQTSADASDIEMLKAI